MEFRPCIDIQNGKLKQIVGGSLTDQNDHATENFVSILFYSFIFPMTREHRTTLPAYLIMSQVVSSEKLLKCVRPLAYNAHPQPNI